MMINYILRGGKRSVRFVGDISYYNNDGYIQIVHCYNRIELVRLTRAEYDKLWDIQWSKSVPNLPSWADYYKKHKSYSERLNEKAKWKMGDRVEISFVDPRAEKHLFGKDHKPLHFVEGYKGTVIKHAEGYLGRLEYLIEFDDHIGSKTSECGKDGHCFWMDESRNNDQLEVRLPMWDHLILCFWNVRVQKQISRRRYAQKGYNHEKNNKVPVLWEF